MHYNVEEFILYLFLQFEVRSVYFRVTTNYHILHREYPFQKLAQKFGNFVNYLLSL